VGRPEHLAGFLSHVPAISQTFPWLPDYIIR